MTTTPTLREFRLLHTDCGRQDVELSDLLARARVFAEMLPGADHRSKSQWIRLEESGYAIETDIPNYRRVPAVLIVNTGDVWQAAQWVSATIRQQESWIHVPWSVERLQKTGEAGDWLPVNGARFKQQLHDQGDLRDSRMEIARESVVAILSAIRASLRDWIAAVDKDVAALLGQAKLHGSTRAKRFFRSLRDSRSAGNPEQTAGKKLRVFIAHGRDQALGEVKTVLYKLGYEPISLEEDRPTSETIIERLVKSDSVFAIILLTPEDEARLRGGSEPLKGRARQNVVFEYGYFIQKLPRDRVFPLMKGDVELPSNLGGMVSVKFDSNWPIKLASAMRAAGLPADSNRL
jgi:predicted nucleotide-binding protein